MWRQVPMAFSACIKCLWRPVPMASSAYGIQCLQRPVLVTSSAYGVPCLCRPVPAASYARCLLQEVKVEVTFEVLIFEYFWETPNNCRGT
ncbi:hypothetical protein FRX31_019972 [Thalictrum thalictroides]|uniref:Uncharacterized protein n=1 Tax=Thalictrum thalictroides TaxID=46969 RepID=A0A7J6VZY5_THATH|nr:hypothetical protein FRX31_019972 [Thalictrum thalictroides]